MITDINENVTIVAEEMITAKAYRHTIPAAEYPSLAAEDVRDLQ